ncbi:MAG TPA: two-component regulator propeller domain-containing protein, partial [Prolixibacteraceae bacterium]|nr:two-component regulator propeller domain-containing protein [Prolixibacteraceae bacterium]
MQFKHLDINSGLTNNQVKTIYEDSNGFIWVGTVNGLNRFDGYSVKVFRKSNNDEFSLPDNNINEIYEDQHGRIWLNTGSGLAIFDPTTEKFISGSQINQIYKSLPLSNIENIFCDNNKQLWIFH